MLIASFYKNIRRCASTKAISRAIDLSSEVRSALETNKPVVALESTIITHGMPHPNNLETALSVESIIRDQGAIPATIGVLNGRIKIGLEHKELELLSKPSASAVKTSRRDFPYVLSHNLNGGTTVSGTLMIASHVGIKVFVTGGVGGVHRQGESTLDISADLIEMGRQPIMVVSSGIKSILDIERTLEYLETQGVCVISYGPSKHFPAFYCEKSGFMAPYHVTKPEEAAKVLFQSNELGIGSGILLAVPIPKPFSIDREIMDTSINLALEEADSKGVHGKEITPFVLERVGQITAGKSLKSNIALIKNNAQVGGQVAVEYQKLAETRKRRVILGNVNNKSGNEKVVVVGGAVLDCVMTLQTDLKADGRSLPGKISQTPGGVGRNIADCLGKLRYSGSSSESTTSFISTLGNDQFGQFLMESVKHLNTSVFV
uniref:Carbohydrate kinase PfkB domain-containing protein n=1 Tax=Lygus hesperus TaxID=30085 RepID=A0A0K8SVA2_LYGHE